MKEETKKLWIFLMIAFGIPYLMGIPIYLLYKEDVNLTAFASAQMFYPAAGVILLQVIYYWKELPMPKKFYISYLLLTTMMLGNSLFLFLTRAEESNTICNEIILIGSMVLGICYLMESKETKDLHKISGRCWKHTCFLIGVFIVLFTLRVIINGIYYHSNVSINIMYLIMLPALFFTMFPVFFGEEYGWRVYLQPILMKHFGKKRGIILFGVLWGIWHLPLDLFYYMPEIKLLSVLYHQVTCITLGIFLGYVYTKTRNIWGCMWIHFLNNTMPSIFVVADGKMNNVLVISDVMWGLLINSILFLPFLCSKEFRKESNQLTEIR